MTRKKIFIILSILVVALAVAATFIFFEPEEGAKQVFIGDTSIEVAYSVEQKKMLLKQIVDDSQILEAVSEDCSINHQFTSEELKKLDDFWINRTLENKGNSILTCQSEKASETLKEFRDRYPEFAEIFLTDDRGLVVATTNRTEDYFQGDEEWWQKAYAEGAGMEHKTPITFDISAEEGVYNLVHPIYGKNMKVEGILKASVSVDSLIADLEPQKRWWQKILSGYGL